MAKSLLSFREEKPFNDTDIGHSMPDSLICYSDPKYILFIRTEKL